MHTTLAIIDVQPKYEAFAPILDKVVHQIKLARRRNDGIVLVEFGSDQPSCDEIYEALHGYDKFTVEIKNKCNGSHEIINAIYNNQYTFDQILLCGVNTCMCVKDTLSGIIRMDVSRRVEIIKDAVNCCHASHNYCLKQVEDMVKEYK